MRSCGRRMCWIVATITAQLALASCSAAVPPPAEADCGASGPPLVIGMIAPVSGDLAPLGLGMRNSADLAIDQANESCTVPGQRFALRVEDDQGLPALAATAATRLAADPDVVAVVGTLNSSTSAEVQPLLHDQGIVQVSPANTDPRLSRGPDPLGADAERPFDSYFRVAPTNATQGPFAARYLSEDLAIDDVAVVDDGKAYGVTLVDAFVAEFEQAGGGVTLRERIDEADRELGALAERIRDSAPEAVYFGGEFPAASALSRALADAGLDVPLVAGDGVASEEFVRLGGRPGDLVTGLGAPPDQLASATGYVADYASANYVEPFGVYGPLTFDATRVVVAAVGRAVSSAPWSVTTRPAVVDAVQDTVLDGVSGPVSFDEFGDTTNTVFTVFEIQDGELVPVHTATFDR